MKSILFLLILIVGLVLVVGCAPSVTPTPIPPAPAPPTLTATSVPPTATNTPEPTDTPRPIETPTLGIGSTRISPIDGAPMVYVPAGDFLMGSSDSDKKALDGTPQHAIYLDAFWIDKFEVTNTLYKKCVDAGKCPPPFKPGSFTRSSYYDDPSFAEYPVVFIAWDYANKYCAWAGKRLPTEAQWEKAARGTDGRIYPWGNTWDGTHLNSCDKNCPWDAGGNKDTGTDDKFADTAPVGSFSADASPYGAMDMAGNVSEWVADWSDRNYYSSSPHNNPTGPASGQARVDRGGSWFWTQDYARAAARNQADPNVVFAFIGFRCAQ